MLLAAGVAPGQAPGATRVGGLGRRLYLSSVPLTPRRAAYSPWPAQLQRRFGVQVQPSPPAWPVDDHAWYIRFAPNTTDIHVPDLGLLWWSMG